jgi:Transglutaminase-like superfamily
MADRWRKFLNLSWRERRLLLRAFTALCFVALLLRLVGLRRSLSFLTRLSPAGNQSKDCSDRLKELAGMTSRAACNIPLKTSCLDRSVTLWWLARREAVATDIRIGVRKEGSRLQGHAWVEYQGQVINDDEDIQTRFAAFDQPIAPSEISFN